MIAPRPTLRRALLNAGCLFTLLAAVLLAQPAMAQKMYRCGSEYKDRPCATGESKVIGRSGAPAAAEPAPVTTDLECARRGQTALKIKWTREAGKTEEEQLGAATTLAERELIADVYRRSGTSGQVRAGIEADCMANKLRAAQGAVGLGVAPAGSAPAAAPAGSQASAAAPVEAGPAAATVPSAPKPKAAPVLSPEMRKRQCERLNEQIRNVQAAQRNGGNAAAMERFKLRLDELQQALKDTGC